MNTVLVNLIQNAVLLLTIIVVLDLVTNRKTVNDTSLQKIVAGVSLGGICIRIMPFSIRLETGVIFDTHSVLQSLSELFFGQIPTIFTINKAPAFPFGIAARKHRQGFG